MITDNVREREPEPEAWSDQLKRVEETIDRVGRALNVNYPHAVDRPTLQDVRDELTRLRSVLEYDVELTNRVHAELLDRVQRAEHDRDWLRGQLTGLLAGVQLKLGDDR
jgi:hypothetical protein